MNCYPSCGIGQLFKDSTTQSKQGPYVLSMIRLGMFEQSVCDVVKKSANARANRRHIASNVEFLSSIVIAEFRK